MKKDSKFKHIDFIVLDIICYIISFSLACYLRFNNGIPYKSNIYRIVLIVGILINIISAFFIKTFKNVLKKGNLKELKNTIIFTSIQVLCINLFLVVTKYSSDFSRIVLYTTYLLYFFISYLIRIAYKSILKNKSLKNKKSLLIITEKKRLDILKESIKNNDYIEYVINGICVIDDANKKAKSKLIVCNKDNVLDYICKNWIDEVYIDASYSNKKCKEIIEKLTLVAIPVHVRINEINELEGYPQSIGKIVGNTVVSSSIVERNNYQILVKKMMDICGGIVGSILAILIAIIIGPIIYIKSPGHIIYKQERIGLNGRRFYCYKFRSMVPNADDLKDQLRSKNIMKGALFKVENDPRIIPGIGNFIRKTSLDEFPQFFNVLKGDMSLVGTRPPTVDEWNEYKLESRIRMSVAPGITGIWQTSGRNNITDFNEIVKMDSYYLKNWSLSLDIKILFKTITNLFIKSDGAM